MHTLWSALPHTEMVQLLNKRGVQLLPAERCMVVCSACLMSDERGVFNNHMRSTDSKCMNQ